MEGNSARFCLALFYPFLFTMLALLISRIPQPSIILPGAYEWPKAAHKLLVLHILIQCMLTLVLWIVTWYWDNDLYQAFQPSLPDWPAHPIATVELLILSLVRVSLATWVSVCLAWCVSIIYGVTAPRTALPATADYLAKEFVCHRLINLLFNT